MPIDMSWHDYNEALVERGSMILDFLDSWKEELREMNGSNKVGSCARIRTSNSPRTSRLALTYRTVQGITRSLSEYFKPMQEVHFTQIRMLSMVRKRKLGPITATNDKEGP
ncbi:MAG: hypothetical protein QW508_01280 [Conexivisphaerales archaeon]